MRQVLFGGHCIVTLAVQTPATQEEVLTHGLLRKHEVWSGAMGKMQVESSSSQYPGRRHWLSVLQVRFCTVMHVPFPSQTSLMVQNNPSSQGVPSIDGANVHSPVEFWHTPKLKHCPGGVGQTSGAPGIQTPAWHWSAIVQLLLSEQTTPSGRGSAENVPVMGSQTGVL